MKFKLSQRVSVLLAAVLLLLGSLSCNLPVSIPGLGGSPKTPIEELKDLGLLNVTGISAADETAVIEYEILIEEDPELLVHGWLAAFRAAGKTHQDVERIILRTFSLGEPYFELTALNTDVQALIEEEISPESFLDRLIVQDQRPPEMKLLDKLTGLGYDISRIDLVGRTIVIEIVQEPVENQAALFSIWWSIAAVVIEESVPADKIQIQSLLPDTSSFIVEIEVSDLEAYLAEEITPLLFLSRVDVTGELPVLEE